MKIKILNRGFYDTHGEKCRLIAENTILEIDSFQAPAPCRSKIGAGVWANGVFIETENYETIP